MSDDRHLETLAQLAHSDHATPTGPVAWDRCDQPLCRTSQAVLADERRHPMPDVRFGPSPNVGEPVAAENIVVGEDVVARLVTELSEARAALARAEARTAALVEALAFYADEGTYLCRPWAVEGGGFSLADEDMGDRARRALAGAVVPRRGAMVGLIDGQRAGVARREYRAPHGIGEGASDA
jgi:hypothetical protein